MDYRWQTSEFTDLGTVQLYALLRLRQQVFVVEQACIYLDLDNLDQGAIHMLCWQGDHLLAYQRCLAPAVHFAESALGRIVVDRRLAGGSWAWTWSGAVSASRRAGRGRAYASTPGLPGNFLYRAGFCGRGR